MVTVLVISIRRSVVSKEVSFTSEASSSRFDQGSEYVFGSLRTLTRDVRDSLVQIISQSDILISRKFTQT